MCGGGKSETKVTTSYPPPSKEEKALLREQAATIRYGRTLMELLEPWFLKQYGLAKIPTEEITYQTIVHKEPIYADEEQPPIWGEKFNFPPRRRWPWGGAPPKTIVGWKTWTEKIPITTPSYRLEELPEEQLPWDVRLARQLYREASERQLKAMRGELELPQTLADRFAEEKRQLDETFRKLIGPDYYLSTPYQKALAELNQKHAQIEEAYRHGEISLGEAIGSSRTRQYIAQREAAGEPYVTVPKVYGTLASMYASPLRYWQAERMGRRTVTTTTKSGGGFPGFGLAALFGEALFNFL